MTTKPTRARRPSAKGKPAASEPVAETVLTPVSTITNAKVAGSKAAAPLKPPAPSHGGKLGTLEKLLRRKTGASMDDMTTATGWQPHSVRGAISGALRKRLGLAVERSKTDGATRYRIAS
jgi:hypothetical protein